jgi:pSer/pThr/pTyr-binding forkhead associated (FHA) protein
VPILFCTAGKLKGHKFRVPDGGLDIGRSGDNHVVIKDDGVSRFHARMLYDNGSLWLQDAGSRNGVFVNEVRVTGHRALKVGDEVTVARHTFLVQWEDESKTPPPAKRVMSDGAGDEHADARGGKRRWFWPFS